MIVCGALHACGNRSREKVAVSRDLFCARGPKKRRGERVLFVKRGELSDYRGHRSAAGGHPLFSLSLSLSLSLPPPHSLSLSLSLSLSARGWPTLSLIFGPLGEMCSFIRIESFSREFSPDKRQHSQISNMENAVQARCGRQESGRSSAKLSIRQLKHVTI
jgi:hypothetical protein